jgi:hypothetical protein
MDDQLSLLKGYYVSYISASPNPMVNRTRNKIKRSSTYFIYKDEKFLPFKLKKSNAFELVSKNESKKLEEYIKNNNLSFRKKKDMIKIFKHISEI